MSNLMLVFVLFVIIAGVADALIGDASDQCAGEEKKGKGVPGVPNDTA